MWSLPIDGLDKCWTKDCHKLPIFALWFTNQQEANFKFPEQISTPATVVYQLYKSLTKALQEEPYNNHHQQASDCSHSFRFSRIIQLNFSYWSVLIFTILSKFDLSSLWFLCAFTSSTPSPWISPGRCSLSFSVSRFKVRCLRTTLKVRNRDRQWAESCESAKKSKNELHTTPKAGSELEKCLRAQGA